MADYVLHSGVRSRYTRAKRMQSVMANRARFVQKLGGGAVTVRRARTTKITEEMLMKHLDEIKSLFSGELEGLIHRYDAYLVAFVINQADR